MRCTESSEELNSAALNFAHKSFYSFGCSRTSFGVIITLQFPKIMTNGVHKYNKAKDMK